MLKTGVIFARFQILHLKQMEYVLAAKMRCKKLYIGITHPDIVAFAATSELDTNGITKRDNPLTFIERYQMILGAMEEFGVKREEFEIIPFPVSHPDLLLQYTPGDAVHFMSVTTPWDAERLHILEKLGLKTEILSRKTDIERGVNGTYVRKQIAEGGEWRHLVPKSVAQYIMDNGIDRRIRDLFFRFDSQ